MTRRDPPDQWTWTDTIIALVLAGLLGLIIHLIQSTPEKPRVEYHAMPESAAP